MMNIYSVQKGISQCDFNKTGCNCPNCPVWVEYQLISLFYCEGAENKMINFFI